MCLTCVAGGWARANYLDPAHPMQLLIRATAEELSGEPITGAAVDGCGAPAYALSLTGLARAYAAIAGAPLGDGAVAAAIREHPWAVGGTGREVTRLVEGVPGIIAKDGAEGVVVAAALPDGRAVAVKIEDGDRVGVPCFARSSPGCALPEWRAICSTNLPPCPFWDMASRPAACAWRSATP